MIVVPLLLLIPAPEGTLITQTFALNQHVETAILATVKNVMMVILAAEMDAMKIVITNTDMYGVHPALVNMFMKVLTPH